jgi:hypothetical protein
VPPTLLALADELIEEPFNRAHRILLRCMSPKPAHRVVSLPRSNLVALRAKRTFSEVRRAAFRSSALSPVGAPEGVFSW